MKHKFLSLLIITAALSTVACSDDKGSKMADGAPQNCTNNPTLAGCSLQKAALAQVPGSPEAALMFAKNNPPMGTPSHPIPGSANHPPGISVASVDQNAIQARAAQIAAGLRADSQNPNSDHYQFADESGRGPASISQATVASVQARVAEEAQQSVARDSGASN